VEAEAVQDHARLLFKRIAGSGAERAAGEYLANYRINHPIEVCMREAGWNYPWDHVNAWLGWESDGGVKDYSWLQPLGGHPYSSYVEWLAPIQRRASVDMMRRPPPQADSEQPGYDADQRSCEEHVAAVDPSGALYADGSPGVLQDYKEVLAGVDKQLSGYTDGYADCMSAAGFPGLNGADGLWQMMREEAPDFTQVPTPGEGPTSAWLAYMAKEEAVVAADRRCREDAYYRAMALLGPALVEFEASHAAEISKVQAEWSETLLKAEARGYIPGEPSSP
jgi:hypothetical protein